MNTLDIQNNSEVAIQQSDFQNNNPELYKIYQQAILDRNPLALVQNSKRQFQALQKNFQAKQYRKFLYFVNNLVIIRKDSKEPSEFLAPLHTGNQTGGGKHHCDHLVKAENYVYASFDQISHHMAGNGFNAHEDDVPENTYVISDNDVKDKAELIFCDVADIQMSGSFNEKGQYSLLENYMNNCFDFNEGKKVLALYLSIIFDSPEDAVRNFTNPSRIQSQNRHTQPDHHSNFVTGEGFKMEYNKTNKMKEVYTKTGVLPPYSLEIRIHDSANISSMKGITNTRDNFKNKVIALLSKI